MNMTLPPIESNLTGSEIVTIILASIAALPLLIILVWNCIKCCNQNRDNETLMEYADIEASFEIVSSDIQKKTRHGLAEQMKIK